MSFNRINKIIDVVESRDNKNAEKINFQNWDKLKKFKIISVDFDDCLYYGTPFGLYDRPNYDMIERIKQHQAEGAKVYICTARNPDREWQLGKTEIIRGKHIRVVDYLKLFDIFVEDIIMTSLQLKGIFLNSFNAEVHYDNALHQISDAIKHGVHGVPFGNIEE